ncbi:hypothetical protein ACFQ9X_20720 [Catenulispora yoronensis]
MLADTAAVIVDAQLATGSLHQWRSDLPSAADHHYGDVAALWLDVMNEQVRALRTVFLHRVLISEWFPLSPGLYPTPRATRQRASIAQYAARLTTAEAERYGLPTPDGTVFRFAGKGEMLATGVGCVRLRSRETAEGRLWFMTAVSVPPVERGIPIALSDELYARCIDGISQWGVFPCEITGKLMEMPPSLLKIYTGYTGVPRLCVLVEEIEPLPSFLAEDPPTAHAAVSFISAHEKPVVAAAYRTFKPGPRGDLGVAVSWLETYVESLYQGRVITDFDEQMSRFPDAVFSLAKIADGRLDEAEIRALAADVDHYGRWRIDRLIAEQDRITITINQYHRYHQYRTEIGELAMGDVIKNIGAGAVVVNRSTLTNALNAAQTNRGEDAKRALDELARLVEESADPAAVESLNALSEELAKPEPNKHRIKTWLDGIAAAMPNVAQIATSVASVAALWI